MEQRRRQLRRTIGYRGRDWFRQYEQLAYGRPHHVLLESGQGGRYSIIGLNPSGIIRATEQRLSITDRGKETVLDGPPLELLQQWFSRFSVPDEGEPLPCQGGLIGYISYDAVRYMERLPELARDDLQLPFMYFWLFDDVVIYDHQKQQLHLIVHAGDGEESDAICRLDAYERMWLEEQNESPSWPPVASAAVPSVSMTRRQFIEAVRRVQQYIAQGDVFQVNLSVRQSQPLFTHPFAIYKQLRAINPSPYMAYLQAPECQVVSGSPELLVRKQGDRLETRPIAGTRSRGRTEAEDEEIARKLLASEKERAEHAMLVDLERNDLGRVCAYGTVRVDEWMTVERYSHVMHIVSHVSGTLAPEHDAFAVIRAMFPGGTITGAPKVRTMEIIEELEPVRRGLYTGSIGWIDFQGNMELNIAIRTMVVKDGLAHVQAGAGIVIDSNPEHEYKECLKKAAALWRAKELSEAEILFSSMR
ncbi:aminodeoxychorismate synthase, component I [Geobacillus sp. 46C-IIa]|uniref:aminodeoxychorismate synthase, component I n=1 Tax=Geobacillus sp. 46C-IIa TaxID=1963025 RepID=UPI0009C16C29|nr:aminodeoxychorismate synthase, component I [Geobacillus sp. 46C-IIa]OQP04407.1 aminodeoxychorismate synthase, component I [Geobacillus sp. 46C-IIa]QNU27828.1 aminodeoxychorismate synthase, component I [Geobacillus sp. 46C-IIa]